MAMQALINKNTLHVICEAKHVSYTYIEKKTKFKKEKVEKWANPVDTLRPTFNQAKKLAKCLHVPFAGLYMIPEDVPLNKIPKIKNLRTFPNGYIGDDSALNIAISDLLQARDFLIGLKKTFGEAVIPFSKRIAAKDDDVLAWASEIREIFNLELDQQFKSASMRKFYLYVRKQIESKGIFVHCFSDVNIETARGVAIYDDKSPIIGINENDRPPAKTFSIIHELTHILKRQSSLCNETYNSFSSNYEEKFCNAVAGEVLVPIDALKVVLEKWKPGIVFSIDDIQEIADRFSVSKEVILRRLLDADRIKQTAYDAYIDECRRIIEQERAERKSARQGGQPSGFAPPPERKAIDNTSTELCLSLYKGYRDEYFSKRDISSYLGINYKHIDKFLREVSSWGR